MCCGPQLVIKTDQHIKYLDIYLYTHRKHQMTRIIVKRKFPFLLYIMPTTLVQSDIRRAQTI